MQIFTCLFNNCENGSASSLRIDPPEKRENNTLWYLWGLIASVSLKFSIYIPKGAHAKLDRHTFHHPYNRLITALRSKRLSLDSSHWDCEGSAGGNRLDAALLKVQVIRRSRGLRLCNSPGSWSLWGPLNKFCVALVLRGSSQLRLHLWLIATRQSNHNLMSVTHF